jgi:hypothetical protein
MENIRVQVDNANTGSRDDVENLTIVIEYLPEDEPFAMPWTEFFSLKLHQTVIHILFIIILAVFDVAGVAMIISKRKNINKRRRARELALDTAKQKQLDEESKKKEDIYAHLQYVEEEGAVGHTEVAGASALADSAGHEFTFQQESVEDLMKPAEPEAPQLVTVSAEQPVFESDAERMESETAMDRPPEVTPIQTPSPTPLPAPMPAQPVAAQPVPVPMTAQPQQLQQPQQQPQPAQPAQPFQPVAARPTPAQPIQQARPIPKPAGTEETE